MKTLIVIGGATASGKTAVAIALAQYFQTEILSADSRQFFQEMTIGTAKPSHKELSLAPHHFIDSLSVKTDYNVGDFERDALHLLNRIFERRHVAILVGGSGLYLKAVYEGLDTFPEVPESVRTHVETESGLHGLEWLRNTLHQLDPEYFKQVDTDNPARMKRAVEVCLASGRPYSSFLNRSKPERPFRTLLILLDLPRKELYARIDARVDEMIAAGLETEARALLPFRNKPALNTVGYQEFFQYFDGEMDFDTAVEKIKQHSRNYAKRQATWFRKHGEWHIFNPAAVQEIIAFIQKETRQVGK